MDKTKNVQETSSLLPEFSAYELKKITDLAENYARKFSLPLNIQFVDEKNGAIAWVVDDTLQGQGNANEGKTIYINTPEFQKLVFERTGEKLKADELLQVALHEIGHLKENAELKYWGEKLQNSGDFAKNFQHELTPFVAKNFEAIKGASLQQKREKLVFNSSGPRFHNFENTVRDIFVNHKSVGLESGIFALKSTVEGNYLRWAFPGEDWTQANEAGGMMPDFAQFSKGMLRNAMTPHHPVKLAPEVEKKLKRRNETGYAEWKGKERSIIEMASDEDIPFPVRLPYIFFLYEEMKKFWDGDLQQQEQNSQAQD